jgi:hypothetical protein
MCHRNRNKPRRFDICTIGFWLEAVRDLFFVLLVAAIMMYALADFLPASLIGQELPQSRLDLFSASATLAGFVVSIWGLASADSQKRSYYMNLAKRLVLGGLWLLIFHLFFTWAELAHVDPSRISLTLAGAGRFLMFYISAVAIGIGGLVLSDAIVDLLSSLIRDLAEKPKRRLWVICYRLDKWLKEYSGKMKHKMVQYNNRSEHETIDSLHNSREKSDDSQL